MVALHAAAVLMALSGSGESVLLDFYADWCGPCHAMDPTIKQLADSGCNVRQVNIDQDRELAARFHVSANPGTGSRFGPESTM